MMRFFIWILILLFGFQIDKMLSVVSEYLCTNIPTFYLEVLRLGLFWFFYLAKTSYCTFCKMKSEEKKRKRKRKRNSSLRGAGCDLTAAKLKRRRMSLNLDRTWTQDEDNLTFNDNWCNALKSQNQATFQQSPAAPDHALSSGSFLALTFDYFSFLLPVPSTASPRDPGPVPLAQPPPPARRFLSTLTPMWGLIYGSPLGVSVSPMPVVMTFGPSAFRLLRGTFLHPLTSAIRRAYTRSNFLGPDPAGPSGPRPLPPAEPPAHSPDLRALGGILHSGPPPPMKSKWCPPKPRRRPGGTQYNTTLDQQQHPGTEEVRRDQNGPTPLASGSDTPGDGTSLTTIPGTNANTPPPLSTPRYTEVRDLSTEELPDPWIRCNSCDPLMALPANRSQWRNSLLNFWRRLRRLRSPGTRGQAPRARPHNRALRCCLPCIYSKLTP